MSVSYRLRLFLARVISSTLKMEATRSSETSVCNNPTRCHVPGDGSVLSLLSCHSGTMPLRHVNSSIASHSIPMGNIPYILKSNPHLVFVILYCSYGMYTGSIIWSKSSYRSQI
jgi:hypothetical protein